mgnify:CR=1 FL=1
MRFEEQIRSDYFDWMYELMCGGRFDKSITYRRLFTFLHATEFVYFVPYDENRAMDGVALRYRYCLAHDCEDLEYCLDGPCSILEMMVALAIRCEERIMFDSEKGDRTGQWFWSMVNSLGLSAMTDYNFDEYLVNDVVTRFLKREYEPDGRGGLFTIRRWGRDARDAEIWHQLLAYLNTIRY